MNPPSTSEEIQPMNRAVATTEFTLEEITEIYNAGRVDYLVPMPMNAKRMKEYVDAYDVRLDLSYVAVDMLDNQPNGIAMLGVREQQGWVTRLGVIPERRRRRTGEFLLRTLIEVARQQGLRQIQLEVIKGNDPALHLFEKVGFEFTRELLILRRAPGKPATAELPSAEVRITPIDEQIFELLATREPNAAWTEATASLRNSGNIKGLRVDMPTGESGWIAFQRTPFLLTHFVLSPHASPDLMHALIVAVHHYYPLQDTRLENIPVDHPTCAVYAQFGYFEAFRRLEMVLPL